MLRFFAMLMLLLPAGYVYGQTEEGMLLNYSQKHGLPSNEAYCVFKDSKGYLWIATDQGVVRHKGGSMEVIKGLPDNVIFKIREDRKGRIWFFSRNNQLSYYQDNHVHLFAYNNQVGKVLGKSVVADAFISDDDSIRINAWSFDNYIVSSNTGQVRTANFITSYGDSSLLAVIDIARFNNNIAWPQLILSGVRNWNQLIVHVANAGNMITYNIPVDFRLVFNFYGSCATKNGSIVLFAGNNLIELLPNGGYHKISFPKDILAVKYNAAEDVVYVGMKANGMVRISMNGFAIANHRKYSPLGNKSISSIEFDDEGGQWFTTLESGVFYCKAHSPENIAEGAVSRMHYYKDSVLLFTTNTGLYRTDEGRVVQILDNPIQDVCAILEDHYGNILIGGKPDKMNNKNLYYQQTPLPGMPQRSIYQLPADNEFATNGGSRVFLSLGGCLHSIIMKDGKIQDPVIVMQEQTPGRGKLYMDKNGGLWHPGYTGIFRYDSVTNKFGMLADSSGILAKGCNAIREMPGGILVASVNASGIVLMQNERIIAHITEEQGLLSNSVRYILPSGNKLYLAMPNGISVIEFSSFSPLQYRTINLSESMGLKNLVIRQLMEHNGNIMIASTQGLYQLEHVDELLHKKDYPIPLYITRLIYSNGDTSGVSGITLPYRHNQLTVNFDAICYSAYSELEYYYRLLNDSDTTWHDLQTSQIVLGNLTPGNYKLQVKAELPKYGRRSAVQELDITIEKPWWQWNAMRIGALLLFLSIVYYIYNRRVKAITRREKEKTAIQTEMAELKQVALRSQMNPHFIFNCLASIQQLVVAGSRDEANEYLVKFSRLIRKTLELSIRSHISLAEEKEYISEYLELEQLRIPGQFEFNFSIDKDINTDRTEIPNMMLQPIVENCVRHGIKHLEDRKGIIDIRVSRFDGYLRCEITDNGVGRKEKSPGSIYAGTKSFGLGIVEKRLTGLAGYDRGNYFIKVTDNINKDGEAFGTKVILQLPLKTRSS